MLPAVIAVDLGQTRCHGVVASLSGEVLIEDAYEIPPAADPSPALVQCVADLRARALAERVPLRAVVVGVAPEAYSDPVRSGGLQEVLAEHVAEPLLVDVNVNLRAAGAVPAAATPDAAALVDGAIVAALELTRGHRALPAVFDATQALDLLRTVVRIPSVTGDELFLGGVVAGELRALGFDEVALDEHAPGRAGVWGVMRGTGGGEGLLLVGHLDTGSAEGWAERWHGHEQEDPCSAAVIDGELWGRGAANGKAGVAGALAAVQVLRQGRARPRGDVTVAFAAGDDGAGAEALLARLRGGGDPRPTFVVALAPTALAVHPSHPPGGHPVDMPQAARLRAAVRSVRPEGETEGAPLWSALPLVTDLGIPAASFGPGDAEVSDTLDERLDLRDYLDSVLALAIFIAEHCDVSD